MANSFLNKVSAERRVLSIVNARFRGSEQLPGLSGPAIDLWKRKIADRASDEVIEILLVLSELCQTLSDRSHESFKPLNPAVEKSLEDALMALNGAVHQLQSEG